MIKKAFCCLSFALALVMLCACIAPSDPNPYLYRGEHPAPYTVANHTLPGMVTSESDALAAIETDNYGRTLYLLRTRSWLSYESYTAVLVITQSSDETQVFHRGSDSMAYCFTPFFDPADANVSDFFSNDEVTALKTKNSWNLPLDETQNRCTDICTIDKELISEEQLEEALKRLFGDDRSVFYDPMTSEHDKAIYLMGRYNRINGQFTTKQAYLVVFFENENGQDFVFEEVQHPDGVHEQLSALLNDQTSIE